jgi:hypothetical protein
VGSNSAQAPRTFLFVFFCVGKGLSGKLLLVFASTVILESGPRGTHDHIFLSHYSVWVLGLDPQSKQFFQPLKFPKLLLNWNSWRRKRRIIYMTIQICFLEEHKHRFSWGGTTVYCFCMYRVKRKVKLSLCLIKHLAMKTYGGLEIQLHHSWPRHLIEVIG